MTYGITRGAMSDAEVSKAMEEKPAESVGGDYQKSMGLEGADQQAAQLKAQDDAFGIDGAKATADSLNYAANDPTPASAQGLTTRYSMFGKDSDTPLSPEQVDEARMSKVADIYTKYGMADKGLAMKKQVSDSQRQRTADARQVVTDAREGERFDHEKKGWAAKEAETARNADVRAGLTAAFKGQREAVEGSDNAARYQADLAGAENGRSLEATIRASAGPDATPDEIDTAIAAFRQSIGDATSAHNAAGMGNLYKQMAQTYGEIGQDPEKAMKFMQMADAEGVPKLIEAAKTGNVDAMNKLWNSTGQARGIVKSIGQNKTTGDLLAVVIDPYSGKRIGVGKPGQEFVNITQLERSMMSAADVAKMRKTEADIAQSNASATASYANADQSRASAGKARAETSGVSIENDYMRTHGGEKPAKASDAKEKELNFNDTREVLGDLKSDRISQLTGKVTVIPNTERENRYMAYLKATGKKNTAQTAIEWKSADSKAQAPRPSKPFDPKAFMH
jgi:hypothetical protein